MRRYALRDDKWERISALLPGKAGDRGRTASDKRLFVEAVLYRYRAGIPWRDIPERFGGFRVIHTRHIRWSKTGVWARVGAKKTECIGRSKGGLSTKIHATCDALGNPLGFFLTGGQACDLDGADHLIGDLEAPILLADKGYDADARVIEPLVKAGKQVVIPPKSNRKVQRYYDKSLYKARHLIENFFEKLKHYRAIATRYDKTAVAFLGAIHLAASLIWLK